MPRTKKTVTKFWSAISNLDTAISITGWPTLIVGLFGGSGVAVLAFFNDQPLWLVIFVGIISIAGIILAIEYFLPIVRRVFRGKKETEKLAEEIESLAREISEFVYQINATNIVPDKPTSEERFRQDMEFHKKASGLIQKNFSPHLTALYRELKDAGHKPDIMITKLYDPRDSSEHIGRLHYYAKIIRNGALIDDDLFERMKKPPEERY